MSGGRRWQSFLFRGSEWWPKMAVFSCLRGSEWWPKMAVSPIERKWEELSGGFGRNDGSLSCLRGIVDGGRIDGSLSV